MFRKGALAGAACSALAGVLALTPSDTQAQLEEVVVTAQRREERVQDVPISISAISGETLQDLNINGPGRLELLTPGLTWGNATGGRSWPSLRGVETANGEANGEASLAYFVDGAYRSRTAQANAPLIDVARVEVLRGPQGTLFGRNSTGGGINVITNAPDPEEIDYGGEVTVGNYDAYRVDGFFNIPFNDQTAGRVAFRRDVRDGYTENIGPGNDNNDEDLYYVRGAVKHMAANWDATLRLAYLERDRNGAGGFTPDVRGQSYDVGLGGRSIFGQAVAINPRVLDGVVDPIAGADIGVPVTWGPFNINNDTQASEETTSKELAFELNYDFGPVRLKSLTAYTDFEYQPFADNDFTSLTSIANDIGSLTANSESFQQEIHLASDTESNLDWVIGFFYFQDEISETFSIQRLLPGTSFPAPGGGTTDFVFDRRTQTDLDSYAVFGQATYRLTDQFSVTGGVRYTLDEKDYALNEFGFLGTIGFNPTLDLSESFDEVTWRVGAEYYVTQDALLYTSVSTGFRSGGFNRFLDDPATAEDETIFDSETITAYEIGWKLSSLFDDRLRLNGAVFYQEIDDQQVSTVVSVAGTGQSGFFNAGATEIYGLELDFLALPVDGWYLAGTLAWLQAEYDQFDSPGFAADPGPTLSLAGNDTIRAPEWKFTLNTGYEIPVSYGTITPILSLVVSDEFFTTQFNTSIDRQPSYEKLDLRLRWETPDEHWALEAFVENVTEEEIISYGVFGGSNAFFANYDPPRMFGVRLAYRR